MTKPNLQRPRSARCYEPRIPTSTSRAELATPAQLDSNADFSSSPVLDPGAVSSVGRVYTCVYIYIVCKHMYIYIDIFLHTWQVMDTYS